MARSSSSSDLPLDASWLDFERPLDSLRRRLERDVDLTYLKFFQSDPERGPFSLGVRVPMVRRVVEEIMSVDGARFLTSALFPKTRAEDASVGLKGRRLSREELLTLGFLIGAVDVDFDRRLEFIDAFFPSIDSWPIRNEFCASLKLKSENKDEFWNFLDLYLTRDDPFSTHFVTEMMLKLYVDRAHIGAVLDRVERLALRGLEEREVKIGTARLLAECFIKFPDATSRYLEKNSLDDQTFNAALQKICDTRRLDDATKREICAMERVGAKGKRVKIK